MEIYPIVAQVSVKSQASRAITSTAKVRYFSRSVDETERYDASLVCVNLCYGSCREYKQLEKRQQEVQESQATVQPGVHGKRPSELRNEIRTKKMHL